MRIQFKARYIAAAIIIASSGVGRTQETNNTSDIERTLITYLNAMSARDTNGLQAVLDKHFVGVKAAQENAKTYFVDTGNHQKLFPPQGNHDWDKDKMKLSSVKAEASSTHPSVAIASFTLTVPLADETLAAFETALKEPPPGWGEPEKRAAARMIADRAAHNAMFAMLVRQDGKWRILCMSLPGK